MADSEHDAPQWFFGTVVSEPIQLQGVRAEIPIRTPCGHCHEPFGAEDSGIYLNNNTLPMHVECMFRTVGGSGGHLLGLCTCHSYRPTGSCQTDPPGYTPRHAAVYAWGIFRGQQSRQLPSQGDIRILAERLKKPIDDLMSGLDTAAGYARLAFGHPVHAVAIMRQGLPRFFDLTNWFNEIGPESFDELVRSGWSGDPAKEMIHFASVEYDLGAVEEEDIAEAYIDEASAMAFLERYRPDLAALLGQE